MRGRVRGIIMNNTLNADNILSNLPPEINSIFSPIAIFPTIDSTNNYLLQLPETQKRSGYVCLAETQTAGRGRLGRTWLSPANENIYMSLLWKMPIEKRSGLSLIVGMAVLECLKNSGMASAKIKWPNDITLNGKKLAGILIEAVGDYVVIGIGINANMTHANDITQAWTSIAQEIGTVDRNKVVAELFYFLQKELNQFETQGLKPTQEIWSSVDALNNLNITIEQNGIFHEGIAKGINEQGALLLQTPSGLKPFYSGEITKLHMDIDS